MLAKKSPAASGAPSAATVVAQLKKMSSKKVRDGMARYGLPSDKAFGVPVGAMQKYAKQLGRNHELALELWDTGWYEARMMAAFLDEPEKITPAQMDRWCDDFDNWGIVDTVCFKLFDQSSHAWKKVAPWCRRGDEFGRRAGFVLLACLAAHDKTSGDEPFLRSLPLFERGATDERNFVKKGVNWALRMVGRRSARLHAECVKIAQRLAKSKNAAARWTGSGALKELTSPAVARRFAK